MKDPHFPPSRATNVEQKLLDENSITAIFDELNPIQVGLTAIRADRSTGVTRLIDAHDDTEIAIRTDLLEMLTEQRRHHQAGRTM
ncbi:MAG: hypothetical protein U0794_13305 [Isosphaeraceae bacterium]